MSRQDAGGGRRHASAFTGDFEDMDVGKLRMLLTVVRRGSFSRAADELSCTQPSITWNMDRLEAELGVRVLARSRRGVRLTPEGEALLPAIRRAVAATDEVEHEAALLRARGSRLVRVGALSSVANRWLPQAIRRHQEREPGAAFEVSVASDGLASLLADGKVDLALADEARVPGFAWRPLWDDPYLVVVPSQEASGRSSVRLRDLASLTLLVAPYDGIVEELGVAPGRRMVVNCEDSRTMLNMVAQGLGAAVMTRSNLVDVPDGVTALPLRPARARTVGVALGPAAGEAARSFASFAEEACADEGNPPA